MSSERTFPYNSILEMGLRPSILRMETSDSYKSKEQPFDNHYPKEPSILDLSLGTPRAVSFASIKSSSSNFSEWQTC